MSNKNHTLSGYSFYNLFERNKEFILRYKKNPLMLLMVSNSIDDQKIRERLLDCIQVFSVYFQKTVLLRQALCEDAEFLVVARAHLTEEFNHDLMLMRERNNKPAIWDPILDATASWFTLKMLTCNEEEKTVLIHFVLEASANIFFHIAHKVMLHYGQTNYFETHCELDEAHEKMGADLLKDLSQKQYKKLFKIQSEGWDMLNTVCERIASLSLGSMSTNNAVVDVEAAY